MKLILVIGSTGNVGSRVVSQLRAQGRMVRAMTRHPRGAHFSADVEVVRGDLTSPESLDVCLSRVDTVFLVWQAGPGTVPAALERIARYARRVVFLSSPYKTAHPMFQQPNPLREMHAGIEKLIEDSGLEWTFLRPAMFAANALAWWAPQIRIGDVVRWPFAGVSSAPIHESDIASIAVRALCEGGHAGAEYVLTGPESLAHFQQVQTIGTALDRRLRFEEISPDDWREAKDGFTPLVKDMLLNAWAAAVGIPAFLSSTFEEITGVRPRTFSEWATDHAAEFR